MVVSGQCIEYIHWISSILHIFCISIAEVFREILGVKIYATE